jgi:DNA-binding MarR family transcriptional regulator
MFCERGQSVVEAWPLSSWRVRVTARRTEIEAKLGVARTDDPTGETPSDVTNNLTFRINRLHRLIDRQNKQFLASYDMTNAEWYVLAYLARHASEKVRVIAENTFIFGSQVSKSISLLMHAGYVLRQDDPKDGRSPYFSISPKGRRIHKKISNWTTRRQQEFIAQLAPHEQHVVYTVLDTLTHYLKRQLDGDS